MAKSASKQVTKAPAKKAANLMSAAKPTESALIQFCRTLHCATEDVKWGHDLVFSIGGKMFAAFDLEAPGVYGCKCSEDTFLGLIQKKGIIPAPYLARCFWVKVERPAALSDAAAKKVLQSAYQIVLGNLPKRRQKEILES